MSWFKTPEPVIIYRVIEVEKAHPLECGPSEVASLAGHPGFQYLCRKLAIQRANLRTELETSRNEDERDIYLKSGIFWCGWLKSQVDFANAQQERTRYATSEETILFNQISSTIDLVGHNPETD